jgi:hypothetical protein
VLLCFRSNCQKENYVIIVTSWQNRNQYLCPPVKLWAEKDHRVQRPVLMGVGPGQEGRGQGWGLCFSRFVKNKVRMFELDGHNLKNKPTQTLSDTWRNRTQTYCETCPRSPYHHPRANFQFQHFQYWAAALCEGLNIIWLRTCQYQECPWIISVLSPGQVSCTLM